MSTKNNSILKGMKQALVMAHNTNNTKAISKDFAAGCGIADNVFESWVGWIESLHYAVAPWVQKFNDKDITDDELKEIYGKVFPILRQLAKVDDTPLFIRESDAVRICGFAAKHGKTANGSVDVLVGKVAFRREIETMLGIRLAQNEVLVEDDYDVIVKYEKAMQNQEKAENRLEGYERNGQHVKGLKEQLEEANKIYVDMKAVAGITKEIEAKLKKEKKNLFEAYPIITGYMQRVVDLEADIKGTEARIEKAKETQKKLKTKYKEIMGKIAEIK